jgi:hypothetical protein
MPTGPDTLDKNSIFLKHIEVSLQRDRRQGADARDWGSARSCSSLQDTAKSRQFDGYTDRPSVALLHAV